MSKRNYNYSLLIVGFVLGVLVLYNFKTFIWDESLHFKKETNNVESENSLDAIQAVKINRNVDDIADIFVPDGQKYDEKSGIVYNCITSDQKAIVEVPKQTREYTLDTSDESAENPNARAKSFQEFFDNQKSFHGSVPRLDKMSENYQSSGPGSTLQAGKAPTALLDSLIDRLKRHLKKEVITMLDIPCGDFFWMRHFIKRRSDVQYTGIDIVPTLIERHRINFNTWPNVQFHNLDIVTSGLNTSYDVIFSRDMLQHLKTADAMKVLDHFSKSGSTLLVTTNLNAQKNIDLDLATTRYRNLNLMLSPVNLIPPICTIKDTVNSVHIKDLSIWKLPLKQHY